MKTKRELLIIEELSKGLSIREIVEKRIILSETNRNRGQLVTIETLRILVKKLTGIDRRFGPRSEKIIQQITVTNIATAHKKTLRFLEQKPTCLACGDDLHHLSYTMLCYVCRKRRNRRIFEARNPLYEAQRRQKNKALKSIQNKKYYLANKDRINCLRRIKRREKRRTNYKDSLRFKLGRLERDVRVAGL